MTIDHYFATISLQISNKSGDSPRPFVGFVFRRAGGGAPAHFLSMGMSKETKQKRIKEIWSKTMGVCAHCGKRARGRDRTIDHFVPRALGGDYDYRNLMPLCRRCNSEKGMRKVTPESFYRYAPIYIIEDCIRYLKKWCRRRRTISGTVWRPR